MIKNTNAATLYQTASLAVYSVSILSFAALIMIGPDGLDIRPIIIPFLVVVFLSALGIGAKIALKKKQDAVSIIGALALAVVFTFAAVFVIAGVVWLTGLYHAS